MTTTFHDEPQTLARRLEELARSADYHTDQLNRVKSARRELQAGQRPCPYMTHWNRPGEVISLSELPLEVWETLLAALETRHAAALDEIAAQLK